MKKAFVGALFVATACMGDSATLVPDYRVLTPEGARHEFPRYSPDGTKLAWWAPDANAGANWQLWVGNADQTNARALPVMATGTGHMIWSPDGTKIATTGSNFTFADVVVVNVADGTVKRVSQEPGFEVVTSWHPDGDRLVYYASSEGGSIKSYVVKTSTGERRALIPEETRPLAGYLSPDGSQVAYFIGDNGKFTVWVADSAGRARRQLTNEGFEAFSFTAFGTTPWSPDGKEVLYESRRTGTSDIWAASVADGATRQITRDVRNDGAPAWSPDGKSIAFISDRGRQTEVWVVAAAGGVEQRVTDNYIDESSIVWRGGTNELAYVSEQVNSSVWSHNVADGTERQLTPDSVRVNFFNLSPDGTQVDLVVWRGGAIHDLAVVPVAGGELRTLVAGGGDIVNAYWSPDGTKIAFESQRGGSQDIWVIDAAGGAPRQVTNWPGAEFYPGWSNDSKSVAFVSDRDSRLADLWMAPLAGGEPVRVTRDGSVDLYRITPGRTEIFAAIISSKDGSLTWGAVRPNGTMRPLTDRGNVLTVSVPPAGDSLAVLVDRPGAGLQSMIIPIAGGRGRDILARDELIRPWSPDGKQLMYEVAVSGANDLGVIDVATGKKTRLTTTPQSEDGSEWTPDGKSVVFRRVNRTRRIYNSDLTKLVVGASK